MPSKQVFARQRLVAGLVVGLIGQFVLAFILGFVLVFGFSLALRVTATLIGCVIATPAALSLGFGCMLKDDARSFGLGVVIGGLASTVFIAVLFFIV